MSADSMPTLQRMRLVEGLLGMVMLANRCTPGQAAAYILADMGDLDRSPQQEEQPPARDKALGRRPSARAQGPIGKRYKQRRRKR